MARSNEPAFWSLFSAGGVLTALVIPVLVVLLGFAAPLGWIELRFEHVEALLGHTPQATRGYVQKVLKHATGFHWQRTGQPMRVSQRMGDIQPDIEVAE